MTAERGRSGLVTILKAAAMLLAACGTLEVGIEPLPSASPQSQITETREAPPASETPEPVGIGSVTGRVCFPSEKIPSMTAYFQDSTAVFDLPIAEDQTTYQLELPAGSYIAYAWLPGFELGGSYSNAVPCGLKADCSDHGLIQFQVIPAQTTTDVDLCDWYGGPGSVPLPPGQDRPVDPLAGLTFQQAGGLWQIDQQGTPIQILDQRVTSISPDGRQALFEEEGDLWLIDLPGGAPRNLTNSPQVVERCARWWPARPEVIIFTYLTLDEIGPSCGFLSTVGVDGSNYRVLVTTTESGSDPAPSPDGQTIAYDAGLAASLYNWGGDSVALDPTAYGLPGLPPNKVASPAWSPDGQKVAWVMSQAGELGVLVFDLEQGTASRLHPYAPLGGRGGWPPAPVWSPDGEWLAFETWGESQELLKVGLWVGRADGSEEHTLGSSNLPLWSPDGQRLAFQRVSSDNVTTIWVAQAGTWEPQQVLTLPDSGDSLVAWVSPSP